MSEGSRPPDLCAQLFSAGVLCKSLFSFRSAGLSLYVSPWWVSSGVRSASWTVSRAAIAMSMASVSSTSVSVSCTTNTLVSRSMRSVGLVSFVNFIAGSVSPRRWSVTYVSPDFAFTTIMDAYTF